MSRTRIKICGITRPEDALLAVEAGADAIGLNLWEHSPRVVSLEQAKAIHSVLPAFVTTVILTVDAGEEKLKHYRDHLPFDIIQFHGKETAAACLAAGAPFIKALRMRPELDLEQESKAFVAAKNLLLDAYRKGVPGGTGERFDWDRIPSSMRSKIILAGGLTPDNVAEAVRSVRPFAVDVSGGVESAPGIKDHGKVRAFVDAVRLADNTAISTAESSNANG